MRIAVAGDSAGEDLAKVHRVLALAEREALMLSILTNVPEGTGIQIGGELPVVDEVDIAVDFHGAVSPQTAGLLIKALEPYQPLFIEEPVQCQNVDVLADLARKTHLPIATGERIFTKWGFREILEKRAASILQPDISHCGGIFEARLIAGMAEAYYAAVAPHCPLGPISLLKRSAIISSPTFLTASAQAFTPL